MIIKIINKETGNYSLADNNINTIVIFTNGFLRGKFLLYYPTFLLFCMNQ